VWPFTTLLLGWWASEAQFLYVFESLLQSTVGGKVVGCSPWGAFPLLFFCSFFCFYIFFFFYIIIFFYIIFFYIIFFFFFFFFFFFSFSFFFFFFFRLRLLSWSFGWSGGFLCFCTFLSPSKRRVRLGY
jgi:hypothetical protein